MCTALHAELLLISLKISRTVPSTGMELCSLLRAERLSFPCKISHTRCSVASPQYSCARESLPSYLLPTQSRGADGFAVMLSTKPKGFAESRLCSSISFLLTFLKISRLFFFSSLTFCNDSSHLQISLVCRVCVCFPLMARPETCFQIDFFLS